MDSNQTSPSEVTFWTPMRVISSVVILAVFAIVVVSLFSSKETNPIAPTKNTSPDANAPTARKQPGTGRPNAESAPPDPAKLPRMSASVMDAEIKNVIGKTFKLSDYNGKVVVLNLWATWCGPCRMEVPELVKLNEEFKGQNVEIVGLNVSPDQDDVQAIREFMQEFKISYTIGQVDDELQSILFSISSSIPQSFLITRDGKVYKHYTGYSRSLANDLRKNIHEALNL